MKQIILFLALTFYVTQLHAHIRPAKIFGSNMVLQRNQPIPVWGWADRGETIIVKFNKQTRKTKADENGKWQVSLDAEKSGGPFVLALEGKNKIQLTDVLVGDVWICSGQSNMEWPLSAAQNAGEEIKSAKYPQIRQFLVQKDISGNPLDDLKSASIWKSATPGNVADFTAVGYFFARKLHGELNVPIGLINTSWGGTMIETWISRNAFENSPDFKQLFQGIQTLDPNVLAKAKQEAALRLVQDLQGGLPDKASVAAWSKNTYNDTRWPEMPIPALWEKQALKDFDGVVWFRQTIEINEEDARSTCTLKLGMIDDSDETYVNGVLVGKTSGFTLARNYPVPTGLIKPGKNIIAVRVHDTGGGGGIYGDPKDLYLSLGSKTLSLAKSWAYQVEAIQVNAASDPNIYPSLLFNAMVKPLIPYAIKGAIWYQGETNAGRADEYRKTFPLMINDWRKSWKQGDFPFYFVQLSSFNAGNGNSQRGSSWAELREAQSHTLSLPNTGMAVTTDIGDEKDIHPRNKQDVGMRLAAVALRQAYGKSSQDAGPTFQSITRDGNKLRISFKNTGSGLMVRSQAGTLSGFDIAGADQKFIPAKSYIEGNEVVVYHEWLENPVAVRYNWADFADKGNLYNKEGFPAPPFRSDNWKGITAGNHFRIN